VDFLTTGGYAVAPARDGSDRGTMFAFEDRLMAEVRNSGEIDRSRERFARFSRRGCTPSVHAEPILTPRQSTALVTSQLVTLTL